MDTGQQRLKFIVCKVLQREAYLCASRSKNIVDIYLMPQGLHNEPDKLRTEVQTEINRTADCQNRPYDAIILGYALCSNGIVGLTGNIPLVVPRGHDCMTLLLGSREKYREYFDSHRGIYWYSPGWIECNLMPGKERYEQTLGEYEKKYGTENAQYLMEMEQNWLKEYAWATYIDNNICKNEQRHKQYTRDCAGYLKWNYDEIKGDLSLLQRLCDGNWLDNEVLIIRPGQKIAADITAPGLIFAE